MTTSTFSLLAAAVRAPIVGWSRRLSRSLGPAGALENVAQQVEEQRAARKQVELLARRLGARDRAVRTPLAA